MADKMFDYPFLDGWTTKDIVAVSRLYTLVADANEGKVKRADLIAAYRAFKEVVPSKAEEKQLDRAFQQASGYSIYRTMQAAQGLDTMMFTMTK